MGLVGYGYGLSVLGVVFDYAGTGPIEIPAVFDGDDGVRAGNHAAQEETSVLVALIAAKQFAIGFRILGYEHDHCSGGSFSGAPGKTFDVYRASDQRECDGHRGTGGDI